MPADKIRLRFSKTGTLRLLSHHDLMRCLERILRRAEIPFKSTAGFHPGPRFVFALSMPLGVAGLNEVLEIEFTRPLDTTETVAKLSSQAPAGLAFHAAREVPMKVTAIPRRALYELVLPADRTAPTLATANELMSCPEVWVERLRPAPKRLNIRPYLRSISTRPDEQSGLQRLVLDLWVTQTGTARADELLRLLGLADLPSQGVILERTNIEIRDETAPPADPNDQPPDGPAHTQPLDPARIGALTSQTDDATQPNMAHAGAFPDGPIVE